jgi:DNA-directed RNA polymerase specialized sigma24 family protein
MTKARLRAYRDLKLERDHLEAMVAALEYGLTGVRMDGMPRSGKTSDPTGQQAIDHTQVRDLYLQKVAELDKALVEIEQAIECLEPLERTLIRLYYAEGLTWEEVCVAIHYEWAQTHRIHARALAKLKDI